MLTEKELKEIAAFYPAGLTIQRLIADHRKMAEAIRSAYQIKVGPSDMSVAALESGALWESACSTCGWEASTKNAQALAVRHFDFTGHSTRVEIELAITYRSKGL